MRKQRDRLDAALPRILDGYCARSDKPREEAEEEAKEFLQILEDSASYQFGYNHSIAYCLLGYLCAWYRHYHPVEFITAFLNNAANDDDVKSGTEYASHVGVRVTLPKWGVSKEDYYYSAEDRVITKGLSSVKYMSATAAEQLYALSHAKQYEYFMDVLSDLTKQTSVDARQLDTLIKIDFFSVFGNQRELLRLTDLFSNLFKKGEVKKIRKDAVVDTPLAPIVEKYSVGTTKSGDSAKSWSVVDVTQILHETERMLLDLHISDLPDLTKIHNFKDAMGYMGYVSGKEEDRRKLYVMSMRPLKRKKDGKQFGFHVVTKSIGSGKESGFTIFNRLFEAEPIAENDIIYCDSYAREGQYFRLTGYHRIFG